MSKLIRVYNSSSVVEAPIPVGEYLGIDSIRLTQPEIGKQPKVDLNLHDNFVPAKVSPSINSVTSLFIKVNIESITLPNTSPFTELVRSYLLGNGYELIKIELHKNSPFIGDSLHFFIWNASFADWKLYKSDFDYIGKWLHVHIQSEYNKFGSADATVRLRVIHLKTGTVLIDNTITRTLTWDPTVRGNPTRTIELIPERNSGTLHADVSFAQLAIVQGGSLNVSNFSPETFTSGGDSIYGNTPLPVVNHTYYSTIHRHYNLGQGDGGMVGELLKSNTDIIETKKFPALRATWPENERNVFKE